MAILDFTSELPISTLLIAHCSQNNWFLSSSGSGNLLTYFLPKDLAYGLSLSFAFPLESVKKDMTGGLS